MPANITKQQAAHAAHVLQHRIEELEETERRLRRKYDDVLMARCYGGLIIEQRDLRLAIRVLMAVAVEGD